MSAIPKSSATARPSGTRRSTAKVRPLKGTVFITRQVHFNSAHRLHNPTKSQAWNKAQYGMCTNPHWHGHNYVLEVTLKGEPDPVTGYLIDLGELKKILNRAVVDKCDTKPPATTPNILVLQSANPEFSGLRLSSQPPDC
jgi:6-pyruvoyl tetrahydropterin synthase/QueD family protein